MLNPKISAAIASFISDVFVVSENYSDRMLQAELQYRRAKASVIEYRRQAWADAEKTFLQAISDALEAEKEAPEHDA